MSQVNTRLHIRVASYDVWKRFKKQDLSEYGIEDLSKIDADSYVIDESSFMILKISSESFPRF